MRSRLKPRYLPVAIGAAVLLIPWFCLSWNLTAGALVPSLRLRMKTNIIGFVQESAPALSPDTVLQNIYQRWVARRIGHISPLFWPAVRWKNQIYYSLLGMAGNDRVIVGGQGQLIEPSYLWEYCGRDLDALRSKGDEWAARIRQMQDAIEARGQVFLYVVTPSKVAQNPEMAPTGYACTAGTKDRADKLKVYDEILARHGVKFVDASSYLAEVAKHYDIGMFPRGGTHWNALGATLAMQRIIAALNAQRDAPFLATLGFTWRVSYTPYGTDRDLLDLLNLPYPDARYPVPQLTYRTFVPPAGCHPVTITEVGGSFLTVVNMLWGRLACRPEITDWIYWRQLLLYAGDHQYLLPVDPEARRRSLLDSQVVIFEENDQILPASAHGELLMQAIATEPAPATTHVSR